MSLVRLSAPSVLVHSASLAPRSSKPRYLFEATVGAGRLLGRAGDCRLWLLDQPASVLWDMHALGLNPAAVAGLLAERFGLDLPTAHTEVSDLVEQWRQAGLFGNPAPLEPQAVDTPGVVVPCPTPLAPRALRLRVADRTVGIGVADPEWARYLNRTLALVDAAAPGPEWVDHALYLDGTVESWLLKRDDHQVAAGQTADAGLVALLQILTGLVCRPAEQLIVLHGAGLVAPDGRGLLLIAPGGSGKTTLAAALNAEGLPLLHDDVVPVDLEGRLLGLGLPFTLKAGSWPVLQSRRPELAGLPVIQRHGQPVRYVPACHGPPSIPVPLGTFVFPSYQPDAPPRLESLSPEAALQGLLGAEAVIRGLNQDKLERLARWVESAPAWSLTYPDLDSGLAGVRAVLSGHAPGRA